MNFNIAQIFKERGRLFKLLTLGGSALAAIFVTAVAVGQTASSSFKPVDFGDSKPLYGQSAVRPTLVLALSVEFPTAGAAYRDSFISNKEYIGYFDPKSCYNYNLSRFERSGAATNLLCTNAYSGNFLNWATSSAIDILRYALSGGDRITDSSSETVLQRAYLPRDFYGNGSYFPEKTLTQALAKGVVPTNLVPATSTAQLYISNCKDKVFFHKISGYGTCTDPNVSPEAADVFADGPISNHYVRVKVCDSPGGTLSDSRTALCKKYPNGSYKPVGNLQKHSDNVRVAVFGYLNTNTNSRNGGVLRTQMKHVGPKDYDIFGIPKPTENTASEWDKSTGVFFENPEKNALGISGAINYLNRFGRFNGYKSVYKSFDPVSELYYEALRYLQGMSSASDKVDGTVSTTELGGFPYVNRRTDSNDPFGDFTNSNADYSCVKNNILTIGDRYTHRDRTQPGSSRHSTGVLAAADQSWAANLANNEPDFFEWTNVVGAFETGNTGVTYKYGTSSDSVTVSNPNPTPLPGAGSPYNLNDLANQEGGATKAGYGMAGMAYWAHTHDIRGKTWTNNTAKQRPGMRANSYMIDVNENSTSSMTNIANPYLLAGKYGAFDDTVALKGNPFVNKTTNKLDNSIWLKQGSTQSPKGYFIAGDPLSMLYAIDEIFARLSVGGNSISGAAVSSTTVSSTDPQVYSSTYDAETWSGNVTSKDIGVNPDGTPNPDPQTTWDAGKELDKRNLKDSPRNVVAGNPDGNSSGETANRFIWDELPTASKSKFLSGLIGNLFGILDSVLGGLLGGSTTPTGSDAVGKKQVEYLNGDRSQEGTLQSLTSGGTTRSFTMRQRSHLLGDIVNSAVVYVGPPTRRLNDPGYPAFYKANKDRQSATYVGANDGMLHAFNAGSSAVGSGASSVPPGGELFAYIPSWLLPKLAALTDSTYGKTSENPHRAFVDASPTVGEVQLNENDINSWKTALVSGTGAGGQGVFALDITDPTKFDKTKVLWEFTDKDDADLGNVVGKPLLLKFKIKAAADGKPAVYKWFAVVASGVNNYKSEVADEPVSASGAPTLFFLSLNKAAGAKWQAGLNYFKVSIPVDAALSASMPPGLMNTAASGGAVGEVTVMYAGDLHGRMWKLDFTGGTGGVVEPSNWNLATLSPFKASGQPAPLFSAVDSVAGKPQPITMAPLLVGGPYDSTLVIFGTGKFMEPSDKVLSEATQKQTVYSLYDDGVHAVSGRSALATGSHSNGQVTVESFKWGQPKTTDPQLKAGWQFDFIEPPKLGERQITDIAKFGSSVHLNSLMPPGSASDPCNGSGSNIYAINYSTGLSTVVKSTVGALSAPMVLRYPGKSTETDITGRRITSVDGEVISLGETTWDRRKPKEPQKFISARASWRQIENYDKLKAGK